MQFRLVSRSLVKNGGPHHGTYTVLHFRRRFARRATDVSIQRLGLIAVSASLGRYRNGEVKVEANRGGVEKQRTPSYLTTYQAVYGR
jgi:hypothetical protein